MPTSTKKPARVVIAVGSGKGGVGKSTVAANLALAMAKRGHTVVFLDADLYGPSLPTLFGMTESEKPKLKDEQTILPLEKYGLKLMSIGFLIPGGDAVVWRGPMLAKMLQQFLQQVEWGVPDYMVVDLPPGTGDIHLTLSQLITVDGVVVVTTPQDLALADVRRAIQMFEKTKVPILGVVENMSTFECPNCQTEHSIFGAGESRELKAILGVDCLVKLPLERATCLASDQGTPIVLSRPESAQARRFLELADQVIERVQKNQAEGATFTLPSVGDAYH